MGTQRLRTFLLIVGFCVLADQPTRATFHFMHIEKVIGGVADDTTSQAIQLRMRANGQNLVSGLAVDCALGTRREPFRSHYQLRGQRKPTGPGAHH